MIDKELKRADLKIGVPAGYLLWDQIEITIAGLRECAVFNEFFPQQSRKLGLVERDGRLVDWKPKCERPRYSNILKGETFDETAPLILRPAVSAERPASWYIEDVSGRAVAFLASQILFNPSPTRRRAAWK